MKRRPADAVHPHETETLLALLAVYAVDGRATVRSVARRSGWSISATARHLHTLRARGLVRFEARTNGTIRPAVEIVASDR